MGLAKVGNLPVSALEDKMDRGLSLCVGQTVRSVASKQGDEGSKTRGVKTVRSWPAGSTGDAFWKGGRMAAVRMLEGVRGKASR